jgi:MFS family permease
MEASPTREPGNRWAALAVVSVAVAMIILDATVVAVALPTVISSLGIDITTAEWVTTIYTVAFAALLIPSGQIVDRVGARRLLLAGVTTFVLGSIVSSTAVSGAMLLGGRLVQGTSGALILPASLATITSLFTDRARPTAFGVWGAIIGGMAALGPLIGGWLTTNLSWRWVFIVNVPVGALLLVAARFLMPRSVPAPRGRRFDIVGAVLVTVALGALTFAMVQGERFGWLVTIRPSSLGPFHWTKAGLSQSGGGFLLALVAAGGFAVRELRHAQSDRPTYLNWSLFRFRGFRFGNVAGAGVNFGEIAMVFVLPLYLQSVLGLSAWSTGLVLSSLAAAAFIGGPVAGQVARRWGERSVIVTGIVILTVAVVGASRTVGPATSSGRLAPWLALAGLGVGAVQAQLSSVILDEIPPEDSGQASGTQSTFRQLGATFGVALTGAVLTMSLTSRATAALTAAGLPSPQVGRVVESLAASGGTSLATLRTTSKLAPVIAPLDQAFSTAVQHALLVAVGGFVLALLASLRLPGRSAASGRERHRSNTSAASSGR